jgi:hypothetical protein
MKHKLITIHQGQAIPSELALSLVSVRKLFDKDKSENKRNAYLQLAYIYWMYDVDSPIREAYDNEDDRRLVVLEEVWGSKETNITKDLQEAADQFKRFYFEHNIYLKVLESAEKAIGSIVKYFESVDMTKIGPKGVLLYEPKNVIASMQSLSKGMDALKELKEKAVKEMESESSRIRGGVKKTKYNS